MALYIDGLFYKGSGIGRYYETLVKELSLNGIKIYTCAPKRLEKDFEKDFSVCENIEPIFVEYEKFSIRGFVKQSKIIKSLEKSVDIFFFPHINLPLYIPQNAIVTIHDLIPFTKWWDRSWLKKSTFKFYLTRALNKSRLIITVSNTTMNDILNLKFNPKTSSKVKTIYNYIDDKFFQRVNTCPKINSPYILFLGNRKKHKNLNILIKAFQLINDKLPYKLVVAGAKDTAFNDSLQKNQAYLEGDIIEFINPSDEEILSLYSHADLFVFPSFYEGFGYPPLESVAMGCPSLVSDIPVMKEVFGDSGVYFNPYDEKELAEKILQILANKSYKNEILKKQSERLKLFNKKKIITEYINTFEQVINDTSSK